MVLAASGEVWSGSAAACPPPAAPTDVSATAREGSATVSFTAPAEASSFTVDSSPDGLRATGDASPITISDLSWSMAYQFTVTATSACGQSPPSEPSAAVTPSSTRGTIENPLFYPRPPRSVLVGAAAPIWITVPGGGDVILLAESAPSQRFVVVRRFDTGSEARASTSVNPRSNTVLFARNSNGDSPHEQIAVRSALALSGRAQAGQAQVMGSIVPGRAGVTIRICSVTKGQARQIDSAVTGDGGRFSAAEPLRAGTTYIAQSVSDTTNAAGQSNRITLGN